VHLILDQRSDTRRRSPLAQPGTCSPSLFTCTRRRRCHTWRDGCRRKCLQLYIIPLRGCLSRVRALACSTAEFYELLTSARRSRECVREIQRSADITRIRARTSPLPLPVYGDASACRNLLKDARREIPAASLSHPRDLPSRPRVDLASETSSTLASSSSHNRGCVTRKSGLCERAYKLISCF